MTALAHATAAQLAEAAGCPKSTIIRRADAEGWAYTEEAGRGGKRRLYAVDQLPAALQAKLRWRRQDLPAEAQAAAAKGRAEAARAELADAIEQRAADVRRQAALRQAGELSATGRQRMDARLAVLRAFDLFRAAKVGMPVAHARLAFCLAWSTGAVEPDSPARAEVPQLSDSTLERWQRDVRTHGIAALAGAYGNRAGTGTIDSQPEVREFVQAMLVQYPHARATQVMRGLQARFGAGAAAVPSMRSLERWIGAWRADNAEVLTALKDPDAWKNQYMAAFGSASAVVTAINELWERDSSPADVMCTDGRYTLIAGVDVFSRRAKVLVARTSKAVAVGAHLRAMLLAFGVPRIDKTDNGSDYTAEYTERVYRGLDIEHQLCPPFQPWHKPHVERFFGTFTRDLVELLAGYIGHSVAERQSIEARKSFADRLLKRGEVVDIRLTGGELQAFCDRYVEHVYHHEPHEGLGGRTPFEVAAAHTAAVRPITDERALDVLLAEAPGRDGMRKVQKKGIALDRPKGARGDEGWYIAPELHGHVGQWVHVRFDPIEHDLGTLYVFDTETGAFICRAQDPSRTGIDRREVAITAKRLQRDRVQAERKALKAAARKVGVDQVVEEILRDRAAATGKLAALPVRGPVHTSPGLAAAAAAVRATQAPQRSADVEDLARLQAARARLQAEQKAAEAAVPQGMPNELASRRGVVPPPTFETVADRMHWLMRQAHVRELTLEEREGLADFRRHQPDTYRRLQLLAAEQHTAANASARPS